MRPDDVWPQVVEAFAHYGKRVQPRLRGERLRLVKRLLADGYEAHDLVAATHGYVVYHEGLEPKMGSDFDPRRYFTPESVFRLEKLEPRIELGLEGPYRKPESAPERRERERREEYERAREEVARERGGLHSVG